MKNAALAMVSAVSLFAIAPAIAQDKVFTISWWGYNGDKMDEIIIKPFAEQCGCEIVFETGNNADRLNKLQIRGNKGVDVIYLSDQFSQIGIENGVFQPVDRSKLTNLDAIYDLGKAPQGEFGPAYTMGRVGIVYDTNTIPAPITSWNDLWRDDLKSSLSLAGITTTAGPIVVEKAGAHAGVSPYEDEDATFEAVKALQPNVVKNYNTGSEMVNLFSTGEVKAAVAQDFTLAQLQSAVPTIVWADLSEGAVATLNTINIPTGSENVELAHQFIDFILSKDVQQKLGEMGVDAPIRTDVELTPEQAKLWTYGADVVNNLKLIDYAKTNAAKAGWIERWQEVFGM